MNYTVLYHGGGVLVWVVGDQTVKGSETGTSFRQTLYFKDVGFNLHDTMIFQKSGVGACGSNYCYWQAFEYMFVLSKGKPKTINRLRSDKLRPKRSNTTSRTEFDGTRKIEHLKPVPEGEKQIRTNIWTYDVGFASGDEKTNHPAPFPERLAEDHILSWSKENDVVLDPFMRSGTTGKMAVLNNRNFIGIEIDQEYYDIAKARIEKANREELWSRNQSEEKTADGSRLNGADP